MSVDGKTLRGSLPAGQNRAVHLLAAYLTQAGVVFMQVAVDGKENEICAAPRLLQCLDLRGKVVMDAMLTQRKLSKQIVAGVGITGVWSKRTRPNCTGRSRSSFSRRSALRALQTLVLREELCYTTTVCLDNRSLPTSLLQAIGRSVLISSRRIGGNDVVLGEPL